MGYFPNGTAGLNYQAEFCERCVHGQDEGQGCAVWDAHLMRGYDECDNPESILHILIPRGSDGNEQCRMFIPEAGA